MQSDFHRFRSGKSSVAIGISWIFVGISCSRIAPLIRNNSVMKREITGKNLTKEAPRSPRLRVGGYAVLGRTIDKCRALVAGNIGNIISIVRWTAHSSDLRG